MEPTGEPPTSANISTGCSGLDLPAKVKNILPPGYVHHLCTIEEEAAHSSVPAAFSATLRLQTKNGDEVKQWLEDFQASSYCTWRVLQTYSVGGKFINFKKRFRCQHNTRPEKPDTNKKRVTPSKHTNCQAKMLVTVKNAFTAKGKPSRQKGDCHLPEFPTAVVLHFNHNHEILCADALKHRDVSHETKEKLISLFKKKYGPTAALKSLKYDLQVEYGDRYMEIAADRSVCPDVPYCSRLYKKTMQAKVKDSKANDTFISLKELAKKFNNNNGPSMAVDITKDNHTIVAICTPLMQRVHALLKHSGELCFMDSSSNTHRQHCSVFLLLMHSCVGGLPIGVLITTSNTEQTITAALELYKSVLPSQAFGGRGVTGPQLFITNDCLAERHALGEAFPQSRQIPGVFHKLQATWRWLWNPVHKIAKDDRPNHLSHMKRMVYAVSTEDVNFFYEASMADFTLQKSFKDYMTDFFKRRHEWAVVVDPEVDQLMRENHNNDFFEATMSVLQDKIMEKTKTFNITQLVDFVFSHLQDYYQRRILDVLNGRLYNVIASRFELQEKSISKNDIKQITDSDYSVVDRSQTGAIEYAVNTLVGHCTCNAGKKGGSCKHQAAVVKHFNAPSLNLSLVTDQDMRLLLHKIATDADADLEARFNKMSTEIREKLHLYPDVFRPAIQAMVTQYETKLKTHTHLASALRAFGKYPRTATAASVAAAALQKRRVKAQKRALKRLRRARTGLVGAKMAQGCGQNKTQATVLLLKEPIHNASHSVTDGISLKTEHSTE